MPREIKLSNEQKTYPEYKTNNGRYMDGINKQRERTKKSRAYQDALQKNIGWMNNLDAQDGNVDGWVKASLLKDKLNGMQSRGNSREIDGVLYYSAKETAEAITDEYFGLGISFYA